jgi:hypothetical protein
MTTNVTEIERAAITNLFNYKKNIFDPELLAYVEKIGTDPEYKHIANELHPDDRREIYAKITDKKERTFYRLNGEALQNLAASIACYRMDGRPDGDQTTKIDEMSQINITTSLAAAVAEFTQDILNAYLSTYNL